MMTDGSSAMTDGLDKLHLLQQPARAPLQRRAQVLAQAAENEQALSEPNWQMVQHAQENANGARNGKRKLEPQTSAPHVDVENAKKPRRVSEVNSPPNLRTRAARGRGRGDAMSPLTRLQDAAVGMAVEEAHIEDNEDGEEAVAGAAPRRKSARVPQKGTR